MKIVELKTYQAVRFDKNQETYFHSSCKGMKDIKMETVEWGILVTTGKDQAIVSFNNVAYAKPAVKMEHAEDQHKDKEADKSSGKPAAETVVAAKEPKANKAS